jgi:hypothetical protein
MIQLKRHVEGQSIMHFFDILPKYKTLKLAIPLSCMLELADVINNKSTKSVNYSVMYARVRISVFSCTFIELVV